MGGTTDSQKSIDTLYGETSEEVTGRCDDVLWGSVGTLVLQSVRTCVQTPHTR